MVSYESEERSEVNVNRRKSITRIGVSRISLIYLFIINNPPLL